MCWLLIIISILLGALYGFLHAVLISIEEPRVQDKNWLEIAWCLLMGGGFAVVFHAAARQGWRAVVVVLVSAVIVWMMLGCAAAF